MLAHDGHRMMADAGHSRTLKDNPEHSSRELKINTYIMFHFTFAGINDFTEDTATDSRIER